MEKDTCTIEMWEDFKREIKRQFYPEDVAYLARKNMRRLKHTGSKHDYVKEFSSLMLEIPNITEEELLFNFRDSLQGVGREGIKTPRCSRLSHCYGSSRVFNGLLEGRPLQG